jgi:hypothetical protein
MPESIAMEKGVGLHHNAVRDRPIDDAVFIAPAVGKNADFDSQLRKSG